MHVCAYFPPFYATCQVVQLRPPWVDPSSNKHKGGVMGLMRTICTQPIELSELEAHYSEGLLALLTSMLTKASAHRPSFRDLHNAPVLQPWLETIAEPPTPSPAMASGSSALGATSDLADAVRSAACHPLHLQSPACRAATHHAPFPHTS